MRACGNFTEIRLVRSVENFSFFLPVYGDFDQISFITWRFYRQQSAVLYIDFRNISKISSVKCVTEIVDPPPRQPRFLCRNHALLAVFDFLLLRKKVAENHHVFRRRLRMIVYMQAQRVFAPRNFRQRDFRNRVVDIFPDNVHRYLFAVKLDFRHVGEFRSKVCVLHADFRFESIFEYDRKYLFFCARVRPRLRRKEITRRHADFFAHFFIEPQRFLFAARFYAADICARTID